MSDWSESDIPSTQAPVTDQPGAFSLGSITSGLGKITDAAKSYLGGGSIISNSLSRLGSLGIGIGGKSNNSKKSVNIGSVGATMAGVTGYDDDWRVRLVLPDALANSMYSGLMEQLKGTKQSGAAFRGVVFPYTPNITVSYTADWQAQKLTHSNYAAQFYNSSEIQDIQIQGTFTAQNQAEAEYILAVLTFGKLVTKMFFGKSDPYTGNPPPIVHLYGHGTYQWNRVPVVIKNFQYSLPPEVDYIAVMKDNKAIARVPTIIDNIAFTVAPVYSRRQLSEYDFKDFANGNLLQKGFI